MLQYCCCCCDVIDVVVTLIEIHIFALNIPHPFSLSFFPSILRKKFQPFFGIQPLICNFVCFQSVRLYRYMDTIYQLGERNVHFPPFLAPLIIFFTQHIIWPYFPPPLVVGGKQNNIHSWFSFHPFFLLFQPSKTKTEKYIHTPLLCC